MPAPMKPEGMRRRRNATIAMTQLPSEGREGPAPRWPLSADIALQVRHEMALARADELVGEIEMADDLRNRKRLERMHDKAAEEAMVLSRHIERGRELELELWAELWALPIATQWEKAAWTREVAQYVRWKVQGELGDLNASKEARMLSDRLGLNPLAMVRLRVEVSAPETTAESAPAARPTRKRVAPAKDPRQHLRALN